MGQGPGPAPSRRWPSTFRARLPVPLMLRDNCSAPRACAGGGAGGRRGLRLPTPRANPAGNLIAFPPPPPESLPGAAAGPGPARGAAGGARPPPRSPPLPSAPPGGCVAGAAASLCPLAGPGRARGSLFRSPRLGPPRTTGGTPVRPPEAGRERHPEGREAAGAGPGLPQPPPGRARPGGTAALRAPGLAKGGFGRCPELPTSVPAPQKGRGAAFWGPRLAAALRGKAPRGGKKPWEGDTSTAPHSTRGPARTHSPKQDPKLLQRRHVVRANLGPRQMEGSV